MASATKAPSEAKPTAEEARFVENEVPTTRSPDSDEAFREPHADNPSSRPHQPGKSICNSCEMASQQDVENTHTADITAAPMSKNLQKKLKKQAAFEAKKAAKKSEEKAAKRAHQEKKLSEVQAMIADMTEEERQAWEEQMSQKRQARKQNAQEKKARLQHAQKEGQRIIVDLDFAEKMTPAEIKSLCQQLLYCYSVNTRAQNPAQLIFTSFQGAMKEQLRKQASGLDHWLMTLHAESYMMVFQDKTSDLVYLTADSPNELEFLDPSKAYIIGGIVDRNRHKNICYNKASNQGISTARLPIDGCMEMTSSPVITVNQVVSILVNYLDHKDWRLALECTIPQRKRADRNGAVTPEIEGIVEGADADEGTRHADKKIKILMSNGAVD